MIYQSEAVRRIMKTGGKHGLNCIAELDTAAVEHIGEAVIH